MKAAALALFLGASPARAWQKEKHLYEDVFTPFFLLDKEAGVYRAAREGMDPETFPPKKAPNAFRVFLVGATTVHTFNGEHDLQHALQKALPSKKVEVLRCGLSGYDSYRELIVLREILAYAPDLVILMGGINELQSLYYPLPPWINEVKNVYGDTQWRPRLDAWLKDNPGASDETWAARRAGRLLEFRDNLRREIAMARSAGVPVIVCSPPINYRDDPPGVPWPWADRAFMKEWIRRLKGTHSSWRTALAEKPSLKPLILYERGREAETAGDFAAARKDYSEAIDAADFRFCSPGCAAMMRETALSGGAAWVDLDAAFIRWASPRMPGLGMFIDQNQWTAGMAGLVSWELVSAIRSSKRFRGLPWSPEEARPAVPAPNPSDLEFTLHYALAELGWRKKTNDLFLPSLAWFAAGYEREPAWFGDSGALFERLKSREKRRPPGEKDDNPAAEERAQSAQLHWHVGHVRLEAGDYPGALADFDRALSLDPSLGAVQLSRAVAESLSGRQAAARAALLEASRRGYAAEARSLEDALQAAAASQGPGR